MQTLSDKTVKLIGSILLLPFLITNIVFARVNITYDMNSTSVRISIVKLEQVAKSAEKRARKSAQMGAT